MPRVRVRRPLIALIVLVLVLAIGYTIRALRDDNGTTPPSHSPSPSVSAPASSG